MMASFNLFQGDTAFKPITQRYKATLIGNLNYVHLRENRLVKPDVRRGTSRTDAQVSLNEFFYERKIDDILAELDFISIRVGSQPFNSDFRGFLFNDTNLGVRVFGNYASNRYQYNLAVFDQLEKDANSGLNTMELRDQQVAIANIYWQDFLVHGYTQQFSIPLRPRRGHVPLRPQRHARATRSRSASSRRRRFAPLPRRARTRAHRPIQRRSRHLLRLRYTTS